MTEAEVAWVAGLLEGEGCFSIKRASINVTCGMTDSDIVWRLYDLMGGRLRGPIERPKRKPFYTWELNNRADVVNLIWALLPFMGERRSAKIREMLKWNEDNPLGRERKDAAQHGSLGMYSNHGCRCDLCREAWNAYQRLRYAEDPGRFQAYKQEYYYRDVEKSRQQAKERQRRSNAIRREAAEKMKEADSDKVPI